MDLNKSRPIMFSGAMVRAILRREKNVTRRVAPRHAATGYIVAPGGRRRWHPDDPEAVEGCPYGHPGSILWVRESWQAWQCVSRSCDEWRPLTRDERRGLCWEEWVQKYGFPDAIEYRATSLSQGPWTSALFMPGWASRIILQLASRRLERLQAITDDEAVAEGARFHERPNVGSGAGWIMSDFLPPRPTPRDAFASYWDHINGNRDGCAWADNPRVWVLAFEQQP